MWIFFLLLLWSGRRKGMTTLFSLSSIFSFRFSFEVLDFRLPRERANTWLYSIWAISDSWLGFYVAAFPLYNNNIFPWSWPRWPKVKTSFWLPNLWEFECPDIHKVPRAGCPEIRVTKLYVWPDWKSKCVPKLSEPRQAGWDIAAFT